MRVNIFKTRRKTQDLATSPGRRGGWACWDVIGVCYVSARIVAVNVTTTSAGVGGSGVLWPTPDTLNGPRRPVVGDSVLMVRN